MSKQPALLYIVPLCLIVPLTVALVKGDLKKMFTYRDHDEMSQEASSMNTSNNSGNESEHDKSTASKGKDNKKSQ